MLVLFIRFSLFLTTSILTIILEMTLKTFASRDSVIIFFSKQLSTSANFSSRTNQPKIQTVKFSF